MVDDSFFVPLLLSSLNDSCLSLILSFEEREESFATSTKFFLLLGLKSERLFAFFGMNMSCLISDVKRLFILG